MPGKPSGKPPKTALIPIQEAGSGIIPAKPAVAVGKAYLAANTKRAYFRDWMDFFEVDSIDKITASMVAVVTPEKVADFRDACLARGLSPGTVNRKLSSLRALFDQLVFRRAIEINPAHSKLVRAPKRGTVQKMDFLSEGEVKVFLGAIDRSTPRGRRDYAAIMTGLHMGLRRSEGLTIRMEDFKTDGIKAYLTFRSKGEKERKIWVNQDLERALSGYAKDRGRTPGWLFPGRAGKPLSGDQYRRIIKGYLKAAGIHKKIGTHGLRATFITINIDKGTPLSEIQKTVGHSRGDTTLGYARDLEMIKSRAPKAMEGLSGD
jgi:site-specific recombinase XerD